MKKLSKVILSTIVLMMLFSTFSSFNVVAVESPDHIVDTNDPYVNDYQLKAQNRTMFRFQHQTQLTFHANVALQLNIDCEFVRIGTKDFMVEIEGNQDLHMDMICTREEIQLGLQMGNTYRIRNRNTYRYEEGFCVYMQCNGTFLQARIRIQATNENRVGMWAYYNEATSEWVSVPTTVEDGYLTATVDHFSYWTVLIPDNTLYVIIGVSGAVVAGVVVVAIIYYKKRK